MSHASDKSVLLTRSADDNATWAEELRARGFQPIECACLELVRLPGGPDLEQSILNSDWLAFTSRRAVEVLHDELPELSGKARLAAVGPATAERLRAHYGRCDIESAEGTGADLGVALAREGATAPIVFAAHGGRTDVEDELAASGVRALRVELYTMRYIRGPLPTSASGASAAFFASPSAVHAFVHRGPLPVDCLHISIGPTTSAALRDHNLPVHAESHTRDLDGMLQALAQLSSRSS